MHRNMWPATGWIYLASLLNKFDLSGQTRSQYDWICSYDKRFCRWQPCASVYTYHRMSDGSTAIDVWIIKRHAGKTIVENFYGPLEPATGIESITPRLGSPVCWALCALPRTLGHTPCLPLPVNCKSLRSPHFLNQLLVSQVRQPGSTVVVKFDVAEFARVSAPLSRYFYRCSSSVRIPLPASRWTWSGWRSNTTQTKPRLGTGIRSHVHFPATKFIKISHLFKLTQPIEKPVDTSGKGSDYIVIDVPTHTFSLTFTYYLHCEKIIYIYCLLSIMKSVERFFRLAL